MGTESIELNNRKKLGMFIRENREAAKLTQKDLSDLSGISLRTISCIESGNYERGTKLQTIDTLSRALNIESKLLFKKISKK